MTDKEMFNAGRHRWLGHVARDRALTGAAIRVAVVIWDRLNVKKRAAWPSIGTMAKELGLNRSTVIRATDKLVERGWVNVVSRRWHSNLYQPRFGAMPEEGEREVSTDDAGEEGEPEG